MAVSLGLNAEAVKDTAQALESALHAHATDMPYAIALVGGRLRGFDGAVCAEALVRRGPSGLAVVMMTNVFEQDVLLDRLAARCIETSGLLSKPTTATALAEVCASALGEESVVQTPHRGKVDGLLTRGRLGGCRVLLVEDNPINQELALELLTDAGAEVTVANDGKEGLLRLDAGEFDVVLMDCQMPVLDGYATTRAIRAQTRWAKLPVIAMTANVMSGDHARAQAAGMDDYIEKPIDIAAMIATIARWYKGRGGDLP
jgi:CheY-like chemotaxis protein